MAKMYKLFKKALPSDDPVLQQILATGFGVIEDVKQQASLGDVQGNEKDKKQNKPASVDHLLKLLDKSMEKMPKVEARKVQKSGFLNRIKGKFQKATKALEGLGKIAQGPAKKISRMYNQIMKVDAVKVLFSILPYSNQVKGAFNIIGDFCKLDLNIKADNIKQLSRSIQSIYQELKRIAGDSGIFQSAMEIVQRATEEATQKMKNVNIEDWKPEPGKEKFAEGYAFDFIKHFM